MSRLSRQDQDVTTGTKTFPAEPPHFPPPPLNLPLSTGQLALLCPEGALQGLCSTEGALQGLCCPEGALRGLCSTEGTLQGLCSIEGALRGPPVHFLGPLAQNVCQGFELHLLANAQCFNLSSWSAKQPCAPQTAPPPALLAPCLEKRGS